MLLLNNNAQKIILSGDIDKCQAKEQIMSKPYKTIIAFTKPQTPLPFKLPTLDKYTGYLWQSDKEVIIKVNLN